MIFSINCLSIQPESIVCLSIHLSLKLKKQIKTTTKIIKTSLKTKKIDKKYKNLKKNHIKSKNKHKKIKKDTKYKMENKDMVRKKVKIRVASASYIRTIRRKRLRRSRKIQKISRKSLTLLILTGLLSEILPKMEEETPRWKVGNSDLVHQPGLEEMQGRNPGTSYRCAHPTVSLSASWLEGEKWGTNNKRRNKIK